MEGFNIREASMEDAEQIFRISNDPEVLKQSINQEEIKWENHLRWYKSKLEDPNYSIVIAYKKDLILGQVKLAAEGKNIIGISMAKASRGKGIGVLFLKEASLWMLNHYAHINFITAQIKQANIISIKSFEKAGYVYCRDVDINGDIYQEYELKKP